MEFQNEKEKLEYDHRFLVFMSSCMVIGFILSVVAGIIIGIHGGWLGFLTWMFVL